MQVYDCPKQTVIETLLLPDILFLGELSCVDGIYWLIYSLIIGEILVIIRVSDWLMMSLVKILA